MKNKLTNFKDCFLQPKNSTHRQYEALRAFFVDELAAKDAAEQFGYTPGSFRVLCSQFRKNPEQEFFIAKSKGPQSSPKKDRLRDEVVAMRKHNLSVYDIYDALRAEGKQVSTPVISKILKEEGFAKLPRRKDKDRPKRTGPTVADTADIRQLNLTPRRIRTKFGGLFLFLPFIAALPFESLITESGFPGSKMIPAPHAMRSLLAVKLFKRNRFGHFMSHVLDDGLAIFAGLNVIPKRAFLTEYSCRVHPDSNVELMARWSDAVNALGLKTGSSFDLDFHTIPFHGEDALVEKHYVSKRSRRQKGILAFLVRSADTHYFCYANADIRKADQNDEILRFIEFWRNRTGRLPEELIFDSKLTTYANLNRLNKMDIPFMTLRRRSKKMVETIQKTPRSAWRHITLEGVSRQYRNPRILDTKVELRDYVGPIRQITIADLGHENPTILITNQLRRSASKLISRYAQRMIIENEISDGIDFFHMDALSSTVALKINLDLQLTLMASSLYRLFAQRIGRGYENAKTDHIFRDFIDATAQITLTSNEIIVQFQKRAHNPLLYNADFQKTDIPISWLGGKRLKIRLG